LPRADVTAQDSAEAHMPESIITLDLVVPNETRYLGLVGGIAEHIAKQIAVSNGDPDAFAYHLNLVLTEAMANAIEYGHDKSGKDTVRICLFLEDGTLCVRVYDHGQGFDISAAPQPSADELSERGRGIFFIRSLMDKVDYRKTDTGNVLEMKKKLH
jgi:serine/threonine-protein kinase RsbW